MKEKYYVTTAIDYVNAEPHIGHAYQKIVADVLARWNTLLGKDVFFLTGTDEHGRKVAKSASEAAKKPKEFVDEVSQKFKEAWKVLNVRYNRFIRTTDEDHKEFVKKFIEKVNKKGDIYLGKYSGYYCVGCEAYITEKDLVNGECPIHPGKKVEKIDEESYFFRLSKYQDFLLKLYEERPEFIQPESRRNEIVNRVREGLNDLSISRTNFDWGIPFPLDKKHVTYVWFDALINYLTGAGENLEYWPASVHLLGKDNTWFHTVYWPAMLKSAGYELPKIVYNHGFLSFNGQKISKSLGNAISPRTLVEKYGCDSVRYFVLRHFPFASGDDGDFREEALVARHNGELVNKLGNLISRTAGLIEKFGMEKTENSLKIDLDKIKKLFNKFELDKVLNEIFFFIDRCNEYLQSKKPWETKDKKVLYEVADAIKKIAIVLYPFIPETAEKISKQFKFKIDLKELEKPLKLSKIKKSNYIFSRIEQKVNKEPEIKEIMENVAQIEFEDWAKLDLRVAQINKVEEVEGADKLYKLSVDLGYEKRTICAGLKKYYSPKELEGMKIIIIANLKARKMKGIESQGMLLAASNRNQTKVVLIGPTKDIELGSKIS